METEYFYEDIVDDEGSEGSWQPQDDTFAPGKNFETETYYVTDGGHRPFKSKITFILC